MSILNKNIFQVFQETCSAYPDKTCIRFKKGNVYESFPYAQLCEKVLRLRHVLLRLGIKPGERIAILLGNGPDWPLAFFAIVSTQAVAVPIDIQLSPEDIKGILIHSASRFLLTEERFGISLSEILSGEVSTKALFLERLDWSANRSQEQFLKERSFFTWDKLAALFYTSGTTQEHKAVMLTHKNLLSNFSSVQKTKIFTKDEVVLSLLPLHHTYPFMMTCLAPLLMGATVCYLPSMVHHELFSSIKENKVTFFVGVPQLFSLIERSICDELKKSGLLFRWTMDRLLDISSGLSVLTG